MFDDMKDKKMEPIDGFLAIRPDSIIEARYSLSSKQNDIIDLLLTKIKDDENYTYTLTLSEFKKIYQNETNTNLTRDFKSAVNKFKNSGFEISIKNDNGKEEWIYYPWFSKIHYSESKGININLDREFKKMLLEVKKKRIPYKVQISMNLKSMYSKRMYLYLKSFQDTGWRIDNIETMRDKLQCPKSYSNYNLFEKNVLKIAEEEINSNSDIEFSYEPIKKGRKYHSIKFKILQATLKEFLGETMSFQLDEKENMVEKAIEENYISNTEEAKEEKSIALNKEKMPKKLDVTEDLNHIFEMIKDVFLKPLYSEIVYNIWILPLKISKVDDEFIYIKVPNNFTKTKIEGDYLEKIASCFKEAEIEKKLKIIVDTND